MGTDSLHVGPWQSRALGLSAAPPPRHLGHLARTKGIFSTFLFQTHCKHQPVIIINLEWDRQSTQVYRCGRQTAAGSPTRLPTVCRLWLGTWALSW